MSDTCGMVELMGWVDTHGVVHVDRQEAAKLDEVVLRHLSTLRGLSAVLDQLWDTRPACATHYPKPCDCE
jgi:hypothetical protein